MCRKALLLLVTLLQFAAAASAVQYAYQVNFRNKNGTQPFSDSLTFLSPHSFARRANQGIALDSTDLPVTRAYVDSVLALTGGKLHCVSKWMNCCVVLLSDSTQAHNLDGKAFISSRRLVGYYAGTLHNKAASSNGNGHETAGSTPSAKTTSSDAVYYSATWNQTLMVNGNYLHNLGYKGQGKIIAVVDAGFIGVDTHSGFDSLRSSGRIIDKHNFTLASNTVYGYDNHGGEILSTMAGLMPDTFVGSAPFASYALYVTEDDNSEQPIELLNMVCAMERADSIGADIISSSLGYNIFDNTSDNFVFATDFDGKTTVAARGANLATKKGMLFVTSAGNEGGSTWNNILTPGDADSALTVGNVDLSGVNASNSGYGPNATGKVKPDVCTLGQPGAVFNTSGGVNYINGTSISTPEVAGWAACLWQAVPRATPAQLRLAIIKCASQYLTPGTQIGYGIPDFRCSAEQLDVKDTQGPAAAGLTILITNPVVHNLDIIVNLHSADDVTFMLADVTGRELMVFSHFFDSGKNASVSYDMSHLPAGMYFLKAQTATYQQVLKLVKQ